MNSRTWRQWRVVFTFLMIATLLSQPAAAARIILKNGLELEGEVARLGTMIFNPADGQAEPPGGELIVVIDDDLRRIYVSLHQVREVIDNAGSPSIKFKVPQPVAGGGRRLAALGRVVKTQPWDDFGRRTMTILIKSGAAHVIQGITEVTPRYFKVDTLSAGQRLLIDGGQRYATSSLATPLLLKVLYRAIDPQKPNDRLRIVQFFIEADRYPDAERELKKIIKEFPKLDLKPQLQKITNAKARRGLDELKLRREAGQHDFATKILKNFPTEGIAGETLLEVREILKQYNEIEDRATKLRANMQDHLQQVRDARQRMLLASIVSEISSEVNSHTLVRLAAYLQAVKDDELSASEKLSFAVSGWLIGSNDATDNLAVTLSLIEVRALVRSYLLEEIKNQRSELLTRIRSEEGGIPSLVAKLLAHMKPPLDLPEPFEDTPGLYELQVPGRGTWPPVTYYAQLPPEYDPYRRYPVVVTLHGAGTTAEHQIDWWAGGTSTSGMRQGQGTRHGYIVIAPKWSKVKQQRYGYSGREHAAVLDTLRDACRRFSVDTDRVFLSGHSMGGDAAWDIGISHPDLWAGVIPVVSTADSGKFNYITLYWKNAKLVPFYFVGGGMDGEKMVKNAYQFDRYLKHLGFDATVVDYQGRGHENFYDEVITVFDWMNTQQRNFFPKKFRAETIRSWDNYFWWLELNDIPDYLVADPENWPPKRRTTLAVSGVINETPRLTTIRVKPSGMPATVWLSPELVDFEKRIRLVTGSRSVKGPEPDVAVMLEDARTRGDRIHPFWARIDIGQKQSR